MIKLFISDIDRTNDLVDETIQITAQLNNRRDVCTFDLLSDVTEGQEVMVFSGLIATDSTSNVVTYDPGTFFYRTQGTSGTDYQTIVERFRVGDVVYVDPGTALEERTTVTGIDTVAKTITVANLNYTHTNGYIGKKIFAGHVSSAPSSDIGTAQSALNTREQNVTCVDYSFIYDAKNINDTFYHQYPREIIGRIVGKFTGVESLKTVQSFIWHIDKSDTTRNASALVGGAAASSVKRARSFVAAYSNVHAVEIYKDSLAGIVVSDLTISIQADSAGSPSGTPLDSYVFKKDYIAQIPAGTAFVAPLTVTTTPGSTYWIVAETTGDGTSIGYKLKYNSAGTGGKYKTGAGAWAADSGALSYKTYYEDATTGGNISGIEAGISQFDLDERIQYSNSIKLQFTGAGTGTLTEYEPGSPVDCTGTTNIRLWHYIGATDQVTGLEIRVGSDASNYYKWTTSQLGASCWHYENFNFNEAVIVGSPVKSAITYTYLAWTTTGSVAIGDVRVNGIMATDGGFTIKNVERGSILFENFNVLAQKPTVTTEKLAKSCHSFWYVDEDRDIHFFSSTNAGAAPFTLTDSSNNYDSMTIEADVSQLKNRQLVFGGYGDDAATYTQIFTITNTVTTEWPFEYYMSGVTVYENRSGAGYVQKTVGVENLDDATLYDYVYSYSEKRLKRSQASALAVNDLLKIIYTPKKPIVVTMSDSTSISRMRTIFGGDGIFDGTLIRDDTIKTFTDGRQRAQAELDTYKNAILTCTFTTEVEGLNVGQILLVTNAKRSLVAEPFLIQKISRRSVGGDKWRYQVQAGTSLYGITEFFQLILKRGDITPQDQQMVDIALPLDEKIGDADAYTVTKKKAIFYVMGDTAGATTRDAYSEFCSACGDSPTEAADVVHNYS